jgi:hypothetical protein
VGVSKFPFEADAPDKTKIPDSDVLGVTVILLTCAYDGLVDMYGHVFGAPANKQTDENGFVLATLSIMNTTLRS